MSSRSLGLLIIGVRLVAVVVGLLVFSGALSWFGRLPGDVRIERDGLRIYVPITSMILVSLLLTLLSWIVQRFF